MSKPRRGDITKNNWPFLPNEYAARLRELKPFPIKHYSSKNFNRPLAAESPPRRSSSEE
jgi:hypothetical protein